MAGNAIALQQAGQLDLLPGYSQAIEMIEKAARVDEAKGIADKATAFQAYARKAKNRDMEYYAAEIRMRAERKAGQLLIEDKAAGRRDAGKGGDRKSPSSSTRVIPSLADFGITYDEAAKWQRIAKLSEHDFELRLARLRAQGKPGSLDAMFSSDSDEWMTPDEILDAVGSVLGQIDLDPCAERTDGRANVPAGQHFGKKLDGLIQVWSGTVYMNAPYSEAGAFVEKLIKSWRDGEVTQAIALLPSRTDQGWYQTLHAVAPVCSVLGRIRFKLPSGELGASGAPFPSAIFYLGPRVDRFASTFDPHFGQISQVRS